MKRRTCLRLTGCAVASAVAAPRWMRAQSATEALTARLDVQGGGLLATLPVDFSGLSYESAQLANPAFFAATNAALIALFRELGSEGLLRLGGGTSEFTAFTTDEPQGAPPFDAVGPDTSKNVKGETRITPKSLQNLRAFLDATNWRCLYGLNLGRGSAAHAADEAATVMHILGPRLIAFQLGNEPDAWRNRYRPATWSYADYWKEWSAAHAAVVTRVPEAQFAGPDVSNKMAYVTGFAEDVKKSALRDVVMLTSHYYAMGPAGAKGVNLDKLLAPDPKLERDLQIAMEAARSVGLPYRMSEGNSCWNGGEPGVSDTLASALWVADAMLRFASLGCAGVNLHGGGNGYYTPIAGGVTSGFTRRPEFYGMKLMREFVGATLVQSNLQCSSDRVSAYVARKNRSEMLLAINKTAQELTMRVPMRKCHEHWLLKGPAIDAREGVTLTRSEGNVLHGSLLHVPPYSAVLTKV
ncbi:MAG: hypothetical protein KGL64_00865 [Acidobacteriota bacterium]|nr:hypothetical protein [Acidobacteriota bacterium]